MTVSLHCGILWTKVEVVGLAWSSRASLTNSPTVITPGIAMPHTGELFFCQQFTALLELSSHSIFSTEEKILLKYFSAKISRHPPVTAAAAALRRGAPSYVRS